MLDVPKALAATEKSDRALGADVLAAWKTKEKRPAFPQAEAIAVKLGLLRRGDVKWWSNHPEALGALAEILRCLPEEIIPREDASPGAVRITAFPELAPILAGQDPCALRNDGTPWVGALVESCRTNQPRAWIVAPSGSGKTLALEVQRQRSGSRIATLGVRRLVDAVRAEKPAVPLVIEVRDRDDATDEGALKELGKWSAHVCVLAPFDRRFISDADSTWRDVFWKSDGNWRERLLQWANSRSPKPVDLDVAEVLHWLGVVDPSERLFATPGDVLRVAARAYRADLPKSLHALARESLATMFVDPGWLQTFGVSAVEALLKARLADVDRPLAPLSLTEWARLLPTTLAPYVQTKPATKGPSAKGAVRRVPEAPAPLQAVHMLADAGALGTMVNGEHDFASWVRAGIERDVITTAIQGTSLAWASWAVDATRRGAVDDALDASSPATLLRAVRLALAANEDELHTVAAIEALFAALGRRLCATEWQPTDAMVGDLQQLGLRQLDLVRRLPEYRRWPIYPALTRQAPGYSNDAASTEWTTGAWRFSFMVPRPSDEVDAAWVLPGWAPALRLADAPAMLPWPRTASEAPLLIVAREVLSVCQDERLPEKVPSLFLPWILIDGPSRGWKLEKHHQYAVLHSSTAPTLIGALLPSEPPEVQLRAVVSIWDAALAEMGGCPFQALNHVRGLSPHLAAMVAAKLPEAVFTKAVATAPDIHGGDQLPRLPRRLHRAALEGFLQRLETDPHPLRETENLLEGLGEEDIDLLTRFVGRNFSLGSAAAKRVWALAPELALEETKKALTTLSGAGPWLYGAPNERVPALLDLLRARPSLPTWCAGWLIGILPTAGRAAPEVFALLRGIP